MKKDKTASNLSKKLKQYTALAISAVATDVSAQVVYTNISDTALVNDGDFFDIDLNNDGITEINLSFVNYTGTFYAGYVSYDVNAVNASPENSAEVNAIFTSSTSTSYNSSYAAAFNFNDSITSGINSWSSDTVVVAGNADITVGSSTNNVTVGQFLGSGDKYLGVRFLISGNTHYGWIRLDVNADADSTVIKDFAYESTPNKAIAAGDQGTPVGLIEASTKKFDFYASQGKVIFRKPLESTTMISIYDLSGRVLMQDEVSSGNESIQLKFGLEGVYVVELRNGESVERKRLWLESE